MEELSKKFLILFVNKEECTICLEKITKLLGFYLKLRVWINNLFILYFFFLYTFINKKFFFILTVPREILISRIINKVLKEEEYMI